MKVIKKGSEEKPQTTGDTFESKLKSLDRKKIYMYSIIGIAVIVIIILIRVLISLDSDEVSSKNKETSKVETTQPRKNTSINANEVIELINLWQIYQNSGNISGYLSLYSYDFQGIKRTKSGKTFYLNYSEWSADRTKMYSTAQSLYIGVTDIKITELDNANGTAKATFTQFYTSANYSDEGMKVLKVKKDDNDKLKIYFEELIYSIDTIPGE